MPRLKNTVHEKFAQLLALKHMSQHAAWLEAIGPQRAAKVLAKNKRATSLTSAASKLAAIPSSVHASKKSRPAAMSALHRTLPAQGPKRRNRQGAAYQQMRRPLFTPAAGRRCTIYPGTFRAESAPAGERTAPGQGRNRQSEKTLGGGHRRKLAVLLLTLWKRREAYEPFPGLA
jgi:hypothetical protein